VWLALDHGLSQGAFNGLRSLDPALALLSEQILTGVVVNRGFAASVAMRAPAGLVLQTFGIPGLGDAQGVRVQTCSVEDAVRLAADAVAVQLDLNAPHLPRAVRSICRTISDAARWDIPVLAMVTAREHDPPAQAVADAVRVCTELGADLIKVGLPPEIANADRSDLAGLRETIRGAAPTLLGGGERREDLPNRLATARDLGFSGACIGRSIFEAPDPTTVLETIDAVFDGRG
jgi:DhnA family fructose-bisphosphate aldolase class Ia